MPILAYMQLPGYALLVEACKTEPRQVVAKRLGVSPPVVTQVLNGTGQYGAGKASPRNLFERVDAVFGAWECPHLTALSADDQPVRLTASRCGQLAHRQAPISSPRELAHWQACRACPKHALTAPPPARAERQPPKPRATPAATPTDSAPPATSEVSS